MSKKIICFCFIKIMIYNKYNNKRICSLIPIEGVHGLRGLELARRHDLLHFRLEAGIICKLKLHLLGETLVIALFLLKRRTI